MRTNSEIKRSTRITGLVLGTLYGLLLLMSGTMKLLHVPDAVTIFNLLGWTEAQLTTIGIVELACALVYLFPPTAALGAVLVTGYFGGAIATHVRIGDVFMSPLILGVLAWVPLYLRDANVRALLPVRRG